jgi:hypothetical protein
MADDDFSKFRETLVSNLPRPSRSRPSPPPATGLIHKPREAYKAFAVQDRPKEALELRRRIGTPSHAVTYNFLHNVTYDRGIWTRLCLTVSGLAIDIRGRNMGPIPDAVWNRQCVYIQEFSEEEFLPLDPASANEPFIESISVTVLHGIAVTKEREDA